MTHNQELEDLRNSINNRMKRCNDILRGKIIKLAKRDTNARIQLRI